jgi:integrase
MHLSDTTIRALKAPATGQKYYFDDSVKGFCCRVSQGGTKVFVVVYGRDRRHVTIGRYHPDILPLAKARAEAKRILAEHTLGKTRPQAITYAAAVELFLRDKAHARRPSTVASYRNKLARLKFQGQLADIAHAEAARRLDRIKMPSERSHVLVAAKVFFNWCIARRYVDDNPFRGLHKPKSTPRDRVLADDEIRALWAVPGTFADYCRLLLLTAQRRGELYRATLEGDTFVIPSHVSKNGRESIIPATKLASSLWRKFPNFDWSREKQDLDRSSGVTGFVLHDIRRTVATRMAELGVAPHVIERILNHVTGQISGVAAVYNRARYIEEMRSAIELWENRLTSVLR